MILEDCARYREGVPAVATVEALLTVLILRVGPTPRSRKCAKPGC